MKRYLVFGGEHFYPQGAWDDFLCDFDTLEDARISVRTKAGCKHKGIPWCKREWNQIIDLETGEEVL